MFFDTTAALAAVVLLFDQFPLEARKSLIDFTSASASVP
jgi:hypothetical protein